MIPKWRPVQVCCKGYASSSNGTSCIPICSQHCYHGQCVEPDVCKCDPGYGGEACSKCKHPSSLDASDHSKTIPTFISLFLFKQRLRQKAWNLSYALNHWWFQSWKSILFASKCSLIFDKRALVPFFNRLPFFLLLLPTVLFLLFLVPIFTVQSTD